MFGGTARAAVVRQAVLYTPVMIAGILVLVLTLIGVWSTGPVLFVIVLFITFLVGYQGVQALRDLREQPRTTRGPVTRIWSKMDLFVSRSYYITVNRQIFRIPVDAHFDLKEEAKRLRAGGLDDEYLIEVQVQHYPHTGIVQSVERLGQVVREPSDARSRA